MDILKELNTIVDEYKGEHVALADDTAFDDLGFDSLDKVDLMIQIEEKFDIQFPDDLTITTAGELADAIAELMA